MMKMFLRADHFENFRPGLLICDRLNCNEPYFDDIRNEFGEILFLCKKHLKKK